MNLSVRRLGAADVLAMRQLNAMFEREFGDPGSYGSAPPGEGYISRVLGKDSVIALVAEAEGSVIGGTVAYVLDKLEQERSEIYIYDLAVAQPFRRLGVATALIGEIRAIATEIGAWVVYVQADKDDDPAIALYSGLGAREDVMHFDISVPRP